MMMSLFTKHSLVSRLQEKSSASMINDGSDAIHHVDDKFLMEVAKDLKSVSFIVDGHEVILCAEKADDLYMIVCHAHRPRATKQAEFNDNLLMLAKRAFASYKASILSEEISALKAELSAKMKAYDALIDGM